MGQSCGLSPGAESGTITGSPGVSPSRVFISGGEVENFMGTSMRISSSTKESIE
jgi:hypothetical protein